MDWKRNVDTIADPETRVEEFIKLGDYWYDNYLSIPLLWVFGKAVYNPSVLEGYEVSHVHFGPVRYTSTRYPSTSKPVGRRQT